MIINNTLKNKFRAMQTQSHQIETLDIFPV